jgi:hypothetical protein
MRRESRATCASDPGPASESPTRMSYWWATAPSLGHDPWQPHGAQSRSAVFRASVVRSLARSPPETRGLSPTLTSASTHMRRTPERLRREHHNMVPRVVGFRREHGLVPRRRLGVSRRPLQACHGVVATTRTPESS